MLRTTAVTIKAMQRQERANANASLRTSPITIPQKPARVYQQRVAKYDVNPATFEYPFSYLLSGDYTVADIMNEPVYSTNLCNTSPTLFPRTIAEWIWGSVKGYSWTLLCRLHNGLYVFYEAGCGPLGFSVKHSTSPTPQRTPGSSMRLVAADTLEYLVLHVLSDAQYTLYMRKTVPIPTSRPSWEDSDAGEEA
jgi:hypothetical protein